MDKQQIREALECLKDEKRVFSYAPGMFALHRLKEVVGKEPQKVSALRAAGAGRLLQAPAVRQFLRTVPDGVVRPAAFELLRPSGTKYFRLRVTSWNGGASGEPWGQTSRKGYNLVLQLNLGAEHLHEYRRLLRPQEPLFTWSCHPNSREGSTLAWARIDFDLDTGEALIEEIQSDWAKEVREAVETEDPWRSRSGKLWVGSGHVHEGVTRAHLLWYAKLFQPYARMWSEAMLAATIQFIRSDIGLKKIFMHTFASGLRFKEMQNDPPPRSLYESLPRRLSFERTVEVPEFLRRDPSRLTQSKIAIGDVPFYLLS